MRLFKLIRMQCYLMLHKKSFQLAFLFTFLYAMIPYLYYSITYMHQEISGFYSAQSLFIGYDGNMFWNVFCSLYPFIIAFPFCFSYMTDKAVRVNDVIKARTTPRNYIISQATTCFIGGFLIICIPFLLNIFLNTITFPAKGTTNFDPVHSINYNGLLSGSAVFVKTKYKGLWFLRLYLKSPLAYNILYTILFSFVTGITSVFIYSISFLIKNFRILLLLPFYILTVFLAEIGGILEFRTTLDYICLRIQSYISVSIMYGKSPFYIIMFYLTLLLFSVLVITYKVKKEQQI